MFWIGVQSFFCLPSLIYSKELRYFLASTKTTAAKMSFCFSSTSFSDWWNGGKRTNSYFALSITHKLVENKANNIKHKANFKNKNGLLKRFITTQTKTVKLGFSELIELTSIKVSLIRCSGFGILRKIRQASGLKVYVRVRTAEITLGITGLHEILGRKYGIEEHYWGPSAYTAADWAVLWGNCLRWDNCVYFNPLFSWKV